MKEKKTIASKFTNRYLMIIRNEEDFSEKSSYSFTYAKIVVFMTLFFVVSLAISIFLVSSVLSKWFDPRYAQRQANKQIVHLATKVDSLEYVVESKDDFILSFKKMLTGGEILDDSTNSTHEEGVHAKDVDIDYVAPIDSQIRKEFEEEDFGLSVSNSGKESELLEMYFFKPVEGIVTSDFSESEQHYAVDIVSKMDDPVKSVANGTVIMANWTDETGYVVAVQHENNLTSIYKHNAVLLKKEGDFVEAGEIIAIIGNSGELTTGPHLHFEMWYKGRAVDPKNYINF